MSREGMERFYRRYNAMCNEHAFDRVGEFVADDVVTDGRPVGVAGYRAALEAVVRAFPDYRWEIRHLLVEGSWIAAHFEDTGTHSGEPFLGVPARGRRVTTQEFALYRVEGERIREVWGTADDLRLLEQLR